VKSKGKTAAIHFRVTPRELAALQTLAERHERNQSDMLRKLIRDGARREGVWEKA
jgi:hypothetical protein